MDKLNGTSRRYWKSDLVVVEGNILSDGKVMDLKMTSGYQEANS
jgi:hypothetical protein